MKRQTLPVITLLLVLLLVGPWSEWARAQSPQSIPPSIPYTGMLTADTGVPYNKEGYFKFAVVKFTESGSTLVPTTLWSNDLSSTVGDEPKDAVKVSVSNGLYGLELGDESRTNMKAIPATVFSARNTYLRVWFSDSLTEPFQQMNPDRQLVSVPYAYQAEKAREISGTKTVVKSIAGPDGTPLTDDIIFAQEGNIGIRQDGNTITIGNSGPVVAVDLACVSRCVSPAEISGPLADDQIPATIARDSEVAAAVAAVADAAAKDLACATRCVSPAEISGPLEISQIPSGIARDTEVAIKVSTDIANHTALPSAHHAKTTSFTELTDTISSAQIPASIGHDLNVNGTVTVVTLAAKYERVSTDGSVGALGGTATASAKCDAGSRVLGGGLDPGDSATTTLTMVGSWPNADDSWSVIVNGGAVGGSFKVYAICAAIQ